ncbi:MAG: 30S ribosomal protein S6 [Leptolyngbyaceae cyanobacterium]
MQSYETMYILRPDMSEDQTDQSITKYQTLLIDNGATEIETQHRGKRRLAYEIDRFREGVYIQMNYLAPGEAIKAMERTMRLAEDVIRYLTIKQDLPSQEELDAEAAAENLVSERPN